MIDRSQYKGGGWSNSQVEWVRISRRHGNPAYYSSGGLGFRTRSPMRLAR